MQNNKIKNNKYTLKCYKDINLKDLIELKKVEKYQEEIDMNQNWKEIINEIWES